MSGIYIADGTAFIQFDTCIEVTELSHVVIIFGDRFSGHRIHRTFGQFDDLVLVP